MVDVYCPSLKCPVVLDHYSADATSNRDRLKMCLQLREKYTDKWYQNEAPEPGHVIENQNLGTAIEKLDKWIEENCNEKCSK